MAYHYIDDIAIADVAFHATGKTMEDLFVNAADATMNIMVVDLSAIENRQELALRLSHKELDLLLFEFLNEFVYYKDAEQLLLRPKDVKITRDAEFHLTATLYGERLDPAKHPLDVDVKAVTLHGFHVSKTEDGWETTVILDI